MKKRQLFIQYNENRDKINVGSMAQIFCCWMNLIRFCGHWNLSFKFLKEMCESLTLLFRRN